MGDLIVVVVLLIIIGGAVFKLYKDKKNNVMCSGCPSYKSCTSNLSCSQPQGSPGHGVKESIIILKKN